MLRSALVLPLLAAAAACSGGPAPLDAEQRTRVRALGATRALIEQYEAALLHTPTAAGRLTPTLTEHRAHLAALAVGVPAAALAYPRPSAPARAGRPAAGAPSGTPAAPAAIPMPPAGTTAAALDAWFAHREHAASAARARDILAAPGDLARLLGSVAACEAALGALLADGSPIAASTARAAGTGAVRTGGRKTAAASPAASATPAPLIQHVTGRLTLDQALQGALSAEDAAVYGYGVAGARLHGAALARATADYQAHRARRDRLAALIGARRQTPVGAAPVYTLPFPVTGASTAGRLAGYLENRLTAVYADLVAVSAGSTRHLAAAALRTAATTAAAWTATTPAFPGLPELA